MAEINVDNQDEIARLTAQLEQLRKQTADQGELISALQSENRQLMAAQMVCTEAFDALCAGTDIEPLTVLDIGDRAAWEKLALVKAAQMEGAVSQLSEVCRRELETLCHLELTLGLRPGASEPDALPGRWGKVAAVVLALVESAAEQTHRDQLIEDALVEVQDNLGKLQAAARAGDLPAVGG